MVYILTEEKVIEAVANLLTSICCVYYIVFFFIAPFMNIVYTYKFNEIFE